MGEKVRRRWSAVTLLRELQRFLDESGVPPEGLIEELVAAVRERIVDEQLQRRR